MFEIDRGETVVLAEPVAIRDGGVKKLMEDLSKAHYCRVARFRQVLRKFLVISERNARASGITPQQYQAILAIQGFADRDWATVGEVAHALQLRHHAASELLNRCEDAGLLNRTREGIADRRQVRVILTETGLETLSRIVRANSQEFHELRDVLNGLESDAC